METRRGWMQRWTAAETETDTGTNTGAGSEWESEGSGVSEWERNGRRGWFNIIIKCLVQSLSCLQCNYLLMFCSLVHPTVLWSYRRARYVNN